MTFDVPHIVLVVNPLSIEFLPGSRVDYTSLKADPSTSCETRSGSASTSAVAASWTCRKNKEMVLGVFLVQGKGGRMFNLFIVCFHNLPCGAARKPTGASGSYYLLWAQELRRLIKKGGRWCHCPCTKVDQATVPGGH